MSQNRSLFLSQIAQTSAFPMGLEVTRAEGLYLTDVRGRKYMDLISGISVSALGHQHPSVVQAVKDQAESYLHTMVYGEFVLEPQVKLATKLVELTPPSLDNVYFSNSGSEAVEGALKLARKVTGRRQLAAMKDAYHGSTIGAMSLNSSQYFTKGYKPLLPGVKYLEFGSFDDLSLLDDGIGGVVVEPVQAEAGIIVPSKEYLHALRNVCDDKGILLIFDESQTGFGRLGSMFGIDYFGVTPDILVLSKSLGGGMPLGAFMANNSLMSHLSNNPVLGHITTFGGHPVCCAAGYAAVNEIASGNYLKEISQKNRMIIDRLGDRSDIVDIREIGLWFAIDLGSSEKVMKAVSLGVEKGIIIDWFLFNDRSIRLAPPLSITERELEGAMDRFEQVLDEL